MIKVVWSTTSTDKWSLTKFKGHNSGRGPINCLYVSLVGAFKICQIMLFGGGIFL